MKIFGKRSLLIFLLLIAGGSTFAADNTHIDSGATAWMLTSTALVLLMIPGLGNVLWRTGSFKKCAWDHYA
jgi:hypothetical protein